MIFVHLDTSVRPTKRGATYQDVLDAPPNMVAEIINGDLYIMPRPAPPDMLAHSRILSWVGWTFGPFGGGGTGEWRVFIEPEHHFGKQVMVPDIAGWRQERLPKPPKTA